MTSPSLTANNFTSSDASVAKINSVSVPTAVTNGYKYTLTVEGLKAGSFTLAMKAGVTKDQTNNQNVLTTSTAVSAVRRTPTMTVSSATSSLTYGGSTGSVTYTYSGNGTPYLTNTTPGIATATIDTANKKVTITPVTAGTTTITLTAPQTDQYNAISKSITVTVNKRAVTYKAADSSKEYNGSALTNASGCTITSGSLVSGQTVTCTNTGSITNSGSTTNTLSTVVIKSGTTDVSSNYAITKTNGTLSIAVATPSLTLSNKSAGYNGSAISINAPSVSGVSGGTTPNGTITYTYYSGTSCGTALSSAPTEIGSYSAKASIAASGNYGVGTSNCATLTITDTVKPVCVWTSGPNPSIINTGSTTYVLSCTDNIGLSDYTINSSDLIVTKTGDVSQTISSPTLSSISGGYSYTFTISATGTGTISLKINVGSVSDARGNANDISSSSNVLTVDNTAPTISYSLASGTYNSNQTITITASDTNYKSMGVSVYKDGVQDASKTNGNVTASTYTITLDSDGSWVVYTKVSDLAGNTQNQEPENGNGFYYQRYVIDTISTIKYSSGNLLYGLDNVGSTTSGNMTYSINNGIVTATGNTDDGWGMTPGRVYLEAGKTYTFNTTISGSSWGYLGIQEAVLMLDGGWATYYPIGSNINYTFTPTVSGTYWLRLDVNATGVTQTFSNILIEEIISQTKTIGTSLGTLPTISRTGYALDGWYTLPTGGTKITTSTIVPNTDTTYYAHWNSTIKYSSGNLLYGLDDVGATTYANMTYSISNGVVTVTGNTDDGYGMTSGRVYLEAGKTYTFNATIDGSSWGYSGIQQAYLQFKDGGWNPSYHMHTNEDFTFTPTSTGIYWLRLDVNATGVTQTFSNIRIEEIINQTKIVGTALGTLPTISRTGYVFDGWYTLPTGGTQITTSTIVPNTGTTYYAHWNSTIKYSSGNLLYGLDNVGATTHTNMTYSINNGVVTVTGNTDDGWGMTPGRVYLETGKTYTFNATISGSSWGAEGIQQAFLLLDGDWSPAYHMYSNINYTFTPTATGTYHLRLDVNATGVTQTFSNIRIEEIINQTKIVGTALGTLPTISRTGYVFDGWYTLPTGGTQITTSTIVPNTDTIYYAHWVDNIAPSVPTIVLRKNSASGEIIDGSQNVWRNYNVWVGEISASDTGGSGISHYLKSYNCSGTANEILASTYSLLYNWEPNTYECIRAVDNAGNMSAWSSPYYIRVDTTAPTISYSLASGTYTGTQTLTLNFADTGGSGINYSYIDVYKYGPAGTGIFVSSQSTTASTFNVSLNTYDIWYVYAKSYDKAGNVSNDDVWTEQSYIIKASGQLFDYASILNINSTGYDVYIYGVATSATSVRMPTWTTVGDQDDLVWHTATHEGNRTFHYRVSTSSHNNESGNYITHIYFYPAATHVYTASVTVPASTSSGQLQRRACTTGTYSTSPTITVVATSSCSEYSQSTADLQNNYRYWTCQLYSGSSDVACQQAGGVNAPCDQKKVYNRTGCSSWGDWTNVTECSESSYRVECRTI